MIWGHTPNSLPLPAPASKGAPDVAAHLSLWSLPWQNPRNSPHLSPTLNPKSRISLFLDLTPSFWWNTSSRIVPRKRDEEASYVRSCLLSPNALIPHLIGSLAVFEILGWKSFWHRMLKAWLLSSSFQNCFKRSDAILNPDSLWFFFFLSRNF